MEFITETYTTTIPKTLKFTEEDVKMANTLLDVVNGIYEQDNEINFDGVLMSLIESMALNKEKKYEINLTKYFD